MLKKLIYLFLIIFIFSCGYKHQYSKLKSPVKIYVKYFKNLTKESRIEDYFTNTLKDELIKRKDVLLTSDPEKADLILYGNIKNFNYSGISFTSSDRTLEFRASMKVEITIIDKNGVKLKTKDFYEYKEFKTGLSENLKNNIDVGVKENLRTLIFEEISSIISEDVFDWLFSAF